MGLFFKKEYEILELPFRFDNRLEDVPGDKALFIDLVFYGVYKEKNIRFNVTFQYYNDDNYNTMLSYLSQYEEHIPIKIKVNKKKLQDFRIDLDDMADKLSDPEILKFERICWGVSEED